MPESTTDNQQLKDSIAGLSEDLIFPLSDLYVASAAAALQRLVATLPKSSIKEIGHVTGEKCAPMLEAELDSQFGKVKKFLKWVGFEEDDAEGLAADLITLLDKRLTPAQLRGLAFGLGMRILEMLNAQGPQGNLKPLVDWLVNNGFQQLTIEDAVGTFLRLFREELASREPDSQ